MKRCDRIFNMVNHNPCIGKQHYPSNCINRLRFLSLSTDQHFAFEIYCRYKSTSTDACLCWILRTSNLMYNTGAYLLCVLDLHVIVTVSLAALVPPKSFICFRRPPASPRSRFCTAFSPPRKIL